jgi:hypothetical protein
MVDLTTQVLLRTADGRGAHPRVAMRLFASEPQEHTTRLTALSNA